MTTVKYDPDLFRMEISGHAGWAPPGHDLVCAGASTLMVTLIESTTDIPELQTGIYMKDALVTVQSYPDEDMEDKCRTIYETIYRGFEALKESYPDNVRTFRRI